jgi:hypothetical protein
VRPFIATPDHRRLRQARQRGLGISVGINGEPILTTNGKGLDDDPVRKRAGGCYLVKTPKGHPTRDTCSHSPQYLVAA